MTPRKGGLEVAEDKEARRELVRHLYRMHGITQKDKLEREELERLHQGLHVDGYHCPPHRHTAEGDIDFILGKRYLEKMLEACRNV